jgi:hypothetical protein
VAAPLVPVACSAERVPVEARVIKIVQSVEVLRNELIVRDLVMNKLGASGLIAAELVMSKLAPCVHSVRGFEPVVRGNGIVRSRALVGARAVVSAGDIAAHFACAWAPKSVLGRSRASQAMLGKTRPGKTMAGECAAAHAVRREPVHATAVRVETATAARVESAA